MVASAIKYPTHLEVIFPLIIISDLIMAYEQARRTPPAICRVILLVLTKVALVSTSLMTELLRWHLAGQTLASKPVSWKRTQDLMRKKLLGCSILGVSLVLGPLSGREGSGAEDHLRLETWAHRVFLDEVLESVLPEEAPREASEHDGAKTGKQP